MMKKRIMWILIFCLAVSLTVGISLRAGRDIREESRASIRQAVIRSAAECYGVEGAYPESLAYLEQNYGLTVNHRDYIVIYEAFASNRMPQVQVLVRGEG